MIKCSECEYCAMEARAKSGFVTHGTGRDYGRGIFYCQHPEAYKLGRETYGNRDYRLITYGTPEKDRKIQIKTRPRWCPRRKGKIG